MTAPRYEEQNITNLDGYVNYAARLIGLGSKVLRLNCKELGCEACDRTHGRQVYNTCPGCNAKINGTICHGCGTWMSLCISISERNPHRAPSVYGYIIPSTAAMETIVRDDTI